jgi:tRNA A37 methylthiotransferase MiaB
MGVEMHKRIHIKTFGCQMNEYDSGKMLEVLIGVTQAMQNSYRGGLAVDRAEA